LIFSKKKVTYFFCIFFYFVEEDSLISEMGVSNEVKNVISLNFLRIMRNKNVLPLVNSTQGHTVYFTENGAELIE
jgi:hypothetical protein